MRKFIDIVSQNSIITESESIDELFGGSKKQSATITYAEDSDYFHFYDSQDKVAIKVNKHNSTAELDDYNPHGGEPIGDTTLETLHNIREAEGISKSATHYKLFKQLQKWHSYNPDDIYKKGEITYLDDNPLSQWMRKR